jgi:acetyl-CoA carboxylase carboxyl transferase subunit beta
MSLFDWFADRRKTAPAVRNAQEVNEEDGLWSKCP